VCISKLGITSKNFRPSNGLRIQQQHSFIGRHKSQYSYIWQDKGAKTPNTNDYIKQNIGKQEFFTIKKAKYIMSQNHPKKRGAPKSQSTLIILQKIGEQLQE
jgi:hypothetical protein